MALDDRRATSVFSISLRALTGLLRAEWREAQLAIIGKGDKARGVLIPAAIVPLLPSRGALASASVRNPDHAVTEREVNFIVKAAAAAPASTHRHAVWLRHTGASHAIDTDHLNQALGHADLKT